LDQRTELEEYFLDSLEYVKDELKKQKLRDIKKYQENYKNSMKAVLKPKAVIPHLKPLKPILKDAAGELLYKNEDYSHDANQKEEKVDIKDLSWEDKEKILRILFAKMNGVTLGSDKKSSKDLEEMNRKSQNRLQYSHMLHSDRFTEEAQHPVPQVTVPIENSIVV
jgi:hypothetical protein